MLATARTFALLGVEAWQVRVEVDVRRGLPSFAIVGLPDAAVRESRERVRAALANAGFEFPQRRITVNLAPANLPKAGPGFDLAIAAGVLAASEQLSPDCLRGLGLVGELALDGSIRSVPGALAMAERARRCGLAGIAVPEANAEEAALAKLGGRDGAEGGVEVLGLANLGQLATLGTGNQPESTPAPRLEVAEAGDPMPDLAEIKGQPFLRRVLEVAASGGHSLLMTGPPGAGKSMAARRLPSILPPLAATEVVEVMRVASACGAAPRLNEARRRPFRHPHHTISAAGLVGGGSPLRPGELTRAHRGLLFLDELAEFSRDALEALRQPLEDGEIVVARARHSARLPCRLMLVAAANPCPCGGRSEAEDCDCAPAALRRYRARLSGPLADRIDISVTVQQPSPGAMAAGRGESSEIVRRRVTAARGRQEARLGPGRCNAELTSAELTRHAPLDAGARLALDAGHRRLGLTGRGHDRVVRVARTLADLDGLRAIGARHVIEALTLRRRGPEAGT
ncbi:MAG: YifB family Mg chelatase-like AAA ATPase [bacterium]